MLIPSWLIFALLSAVFAAFVAILGKKGMENIDSNLATAVRSLVMTLFLIIVATSLGLGSKLGTINKTALGLITLSGIAGALSWLFQFRALQLAEVTRVAPIDKLSMPLGILLAVILLRERPSILNWMGIGLIVIGAYLAALPKSA